MTHARKGREVPQAAAMGAVLGRAGGRGISGASGPTRPATSHPVFADLSFEPSWELQGQHQSLEHHGQVVGDHSAAEPSAELLQGAPQPGQALRASSGSEEPGRP
jgi:hypothetical protein